MSIGGYCIIKGKEYYTSSRGYSNSHRENYQRGWWNIYLMRGEGKNRTLSFEIIRTNSLQIKMGGTTGKPILFYPVKLSSDNGELNNSMVVAYSVLHDCTVNIEDAPTQLWI